MYQPTSNAASLAIEVYGPTAQIHVGDDGARREAVVSINGHAGRGPFGYGATDDEAEADLARRLGDRVQCDCCNGRVPRECSRVVRDLLRVCDSCIERALSWR